MKKIYKLMITILSLMIILVGCSDSSEIKLDPKNPVIITLATYYNDKQLNDLNEMIRNFNENEGSEKGIIVELISSGSVFETNKILLDSANDAPGSIEFPNIFITYKGLIMELEGKKEVIDYRDYFSEEELGQYLENLISTGKFEADQEKISMLPMANSTIITFINKTDFDEIAQKIGVNYDMLDTYEGIMEVAEKYYQYTDSLTPEPHDGKALYGMDAIVSQILAIHKSTGQDILTKTDGKVEVNFQKDFAKKMWDTFYVPTMKGYFAKYGKFTSEDMKTGKILVSSASTAGAGYYPSKILLEDGQEKNIEIITRFAPTIKGHDGLSVQQGGGIFISKSTPNKEYAAAEFVKWMTNRENNTMFTLRSSYIPVRVDNTSIEDIKQTITENNINEIVTASLVTSIDQIKTRKPYISPNIQGYEDVRSIVESVFAHEMNDARETLLDEVSQGKDYDQAVAEAISEESFELWYQDTLSRLQQAIQ
ncbi:MAG: extracellular solute-binding protein [Peptostreptococcaceae bacterium]|nr:extracellular solute-binding protein [Peptostreptococcaceae bacterium]